MKHSVITHTIGSIFLFFMFIIPYGASAQYQTFNTQLQQIYYPSNVLVHRYYPVPITPPQYTYMAPATVSNNLTVQTGLAHQNGTRAATLSGVVSFHQPSAARMWFEYGTNQNMTASTYSVNIAWSAARTSYAFSIPVTNLITNGTYYYRAVAQNSAGRVVVGTVNTFKVSGYTYVPPYSYYHNNDYPFSHTQYYHNNTCHCHYNYNNDYDHYNNNSVSVSKTTYYRGNDIAVRYTLSHVNNDTAWIGLYRVGNSNSEYYTRKYLSSSSDSGTIYFTVNSTGTYEFRLFNNNGNRVATSRTFTVWD